MSADLPSPSLAIDAVLCATSMQLEIAAEDAEQAIDSVLESFETAAAAVESLESAMHRPDGVDREALLPTVISLRKLLRRSVVDLQFQDRLMQRMAMASREMRAIADGNDTQLFADGAVPRSAASLYDAAQLKRINAAAGQEVSGPNPPPAPADDDIELF